MTPYQIIPLSGTLVLIRWQRSPDAMESFEFVKALQAFLEATEQPQYLISDLRKGHITNASVLKRLGQLSTHERWADSVAFGGGFAPRVYVGLFDQMRPNRTAAPEIWPNASDALAYLEKQKPGITAGIDWEKVLAD